MPHLREAHSVVSCEFCKKAPGDVELELLNMSEGECLVANVCSMCAVLASGTRVSYDSDGIPYTNLGCIGGAPEEVN